MMLIIKWGVRLTAIQSISEPPPARRLRGTRAYMMGRPGRRRPSREGRGGGGEAVGRPQAAPIVRRGGVRSLLWPPPSSPCFLSSPQRRLKFDRGWGRIPISNSPLSSHGLQEVEPLLHTLGVDPPRNTTALAFLSCVTEAAHV